LQAQLADARHDVVVDVMAIFDVCLRLHRCGMCCEPSGEVIGNGGRVTDELPTAGANAFHLGRPWRLQEGSQGLGRWGCRVSRRVTTI
jgi:hypothetical protein